MNHVITVDRLRHDGAALRPVRIEHLALDAGHRVAILGVDASGAEILVNVLTGATLPTAGIVRLFGRDTSDITDPDDWIATLDRIGLISARSVLVGELTVAQDLALAFTLSVDPVADAVTAGVRRLAVEAGVPLAELGRLFRETSLEVRARCHLARALATDPSVLVLEHANALTAPADVPAFGRDIARVADGRHLAVLAFTADEAFAGAVARRVYVVDAATGALVSRSGWRRWF
jgi:ABC-type transporter Mla maintaining outer membrane lipid asymmetry ATPase subunit MlaF